MFNKCNDIDREKFSETVIDLLVQLKEFSENSDELYQQMKQVSHLNPLGSNIGSSTEGGSPSAIWL